MEAPLLSILIPTYNRADLLPQTLQSVVEQGEFLKNVEIIISNDGSKDSTKQLLESFKSQHSELNIALHHHSSNLGGPGNWDFLLKQAQGQYVYLLSDDDLISKDFLKQYFGVIQQYPGVDIVYSGMEYRNDQMETLSVTDLSSVSGLVSGEERLKNQLRANHMVMSSMYRRQTLITAGGWQAKYGTHLDGAAFSRTALYSQQTYFINEPLFYFRVGTQTWSTFKVEKQKQHYIWYRSIIDDLIKEAQILKPQLLIFLKTCYAGHAQSVLNILDIKMVHGNIDKKTLRRLLVDLVQVFPEVLKLSSYYKMCAVSFLGINWLVGLRKILNKPDIKNTSVFERTGS